MNRFPILVLLIVACAHVTEPLSDAPNLFAALTGGAVAPVVAPGECPEWIKLEGTIDDPAEFVAQMHACEHRSMVVEINSPGGSVFGALEIQKAIERHPHPVVCVVDGLAASAAFITLQSCDLRAMTDRSILMTHHAAIPKAGGQNQELQNLVDVLHALDRALALRCSKRMGITPEVYESHVSGGREWWMGLEDAKKNHAIDFEVSSVKEALEIVKGS